MLFRSAKQLAFFVPFDGATLPDGSKLNVWDWFGRVLADPLPDLQWQAVVELSHITGPIADELLATYAASGPDPSTRSRAIRAVEARRSK